MEDRIMIKGATINTYPGYYIVTVGNKRYKAHSLRGCFKAANGRWPREGELDKFIELVAEIRGD